METETKRLYEGMFLIDSALAASDWKGVNDAIETVLKKSGADIVSMRKWEDRRLAYEIKKKSRGTYILVYFNVLPEKLDTIERSVQLSEEIMRVLILRTDRMTAEDMEKPTPAMSEQTHAAETVPADDVEDSDIEVEDAPDSDSEE